MVSAIHFLEAGHCEQIEKLVNPKTGEWRRIRFPSSVAVIEHAREGVILFDTGYSPKFHEATKYFPEKFYAMVTPVTITPETTALYKLKKMGIQVDDVKHVVLSHFHADHVAGMGDFTSAKYVYHSKEFAEFNQRSKIWQISHGFLAKLIPGDFIERSNTISEFLSPLPELGEGWFGKDLFNDESVFLVPLLGHTPGHVGLLVRVKDGNTYFLIGDATWTLPSLKAKSYPATIAELVIYDRKEYHRTFDRLHALTTQIDSSKVKVIPCHCHPTLLEHGLV